MIIMYTCNKIISKKRNKCYTRLIKLVMLQKIMFENRILE